MSEATTAATESLIRQFNLLAYFTARDQVTYLEAARAFGTTPEQIRKDLERLYYNCGYGQLAGGDLIEIELGSDYAQIYDAKGLDRPLKLTGPEAVSLLIALSTVAATPGRVSPDATLRAMEKIRAAVGSEASSELERLGTRPETADAPALAAIRTAVASGRALRLTYAAETSGETTERVVDPVDVVEHRAAGDALHSYLHAWCRRAEAFRHFRFDRILDATVLDEPAAPPTAEHSTRVITGAVSESIGDLAELLLDPRSAYALESTNLEPVGELVPGSSEPIPVRMRFANLDWMARFVLGYGGALTVLAPPELAALVARRAADALALYPATER